ncbi:MAG TPA: hypothetical protein VF031_07665 [Alphaproteobacteria bacterium]
MVAVAVSAIAALNGAVLLGDPDTQWHIETGRWMAAHLRVPDRDVFSHSLPGAPWHAHEWLSELLFWWAYGLAGWSGAVALAAAAAGLAFGLLASALQRHLDPRHVVLLCVLAFGVASQHLLARPHVLAWPLLALWVHVLVSSVERGVAPHYGWTAVPALWANLHGGHVFGLALAFFFAAEAIWRSEPAARRSSAIGWAGFLFAAMLASFLTPHHPAAGLAFALGFLNGNGFVAALTEWQPSDFSRISGLELALLSLVALGFVTQFKLPFFRLLLLLGLLHLALAHHRHGELLGLVAPLAMAPALGQWLKGIQPAQGPRLDGSGVTVGAMAPITLAAAAIAASLVSPAPPPAVAPAAALRAAEEAGATGRPVLNAFDFGGFLIAQHVPVFIDGRADLYGADFISQYLEATGVARPGALEQLLERYAIGWTMLKPGTPAIAVLDRLPGWQRVHADATAVIHLRKSR